jgi:diacylglycerol kinase (ATP)
MPYGSNDLTQFFRSVSSVDRTSRKLLPEVHVQSRCGGEVPAEPKTLMCILNPTAGKGNAKKIEPQILRSLDSKKIPYEFVRTTSAQAATQTAKRAAGRYDTVVAIGGDGTVNSVAAGLLNSSTALGVVSVGSGNDFSKIFGMSRNPVTALETALGGKRRKIDAGHVHVTTQASAEPAERYFFNTLGMGFDAAVANEVSRIRWLTGLPLYGIALLRSLVHTAPQEFLIHNNGTVDRQMCYLICVGNGNWEGGGFGLTPHAVPDDNKFEVCLLRGNRLREVLPVIPKVLSGTHGESPQVLFLDTDHLTIESQKPFPVHGDGEIFGLDVMKVSVRMIPHGLTVLVP